MYVLCVCVLINVKLSGLTTIACVKVSPHNFLHLFLCIYSCSPPKKDLREPTWKQWREFLIKYSFLPYQLIAEFSLGLAGGPLLDVTVSHRQRHAPLGFWNYSLLEDLVQK